MDRTVNTSAGNSGSRAGLYTAEVMRALENRSAGGCGGDGERWEPTGDNHWTGREKMLVTGNREKKAVTFSLNYFYFSYCFPFLLLPPPRRLCSRLCLFVCCSVCQQNCTKNYLTAGVKATVSMFCNFSYLLVCFAVSTNLPPLYVTI